MGISEALGQRLMRLVPPGNITCVFVPTDEKRRNFKFPAKVRALSITSSTIRKRHFFHFDSSKHRGPQRDVRLSFCSFLHKKYPFKQGFYSCCYSHGSTQLLFVVTTVTLTSLLLFIILGSRFNCRRFSGVFKFMVSNQQQRYWFIYIESLPSIVEKK